MLSPVLALILLCEDKPIPDVTALMKEVLEHQKQLYGLRENYTFHRIHRVEELDSKGVVKKVTTQEREVVFINGHQIARLVKKDDRPLSDAEDKAEQDRVRKLTENFMKKPPVTGRGGGARLITMILAVSEVSNPRRTEWKGRPNAGV